MIGGSGEKKTFRLVAKYADEANMTCPINEVPRKLDALAQRCAEEGRDRAEITVSVMGRACIAPTHEQARQELDAGLLRLGLDVASMSEDDAEAIRALVPYGDPDAIGERFATDLLPGVDGFTVSAPANCHIEGRVALLGEVLAKVVG
jgi:alkanesulfonate monooxygenase SsuD/methylene tetrahydromethanopterin reductase-like flavin-dependent oxidoreductase (luciferase family)